MRKNNESIQPGDKVFLRIAQTDEKETRKKLDTIAEGPFPVMRVNSVAKKVVTKRPVESVENDSRS